LQCTSAFSIIFICLILMFCRLDILVFGVLSRSTDRLKSKQSKAETEHCIKANVWLVPLNLCHIQFSQFCLRESYPADTDPVNHSYHSSARRDWKSLKKRRSDGKEKRIGVILCHCTKLTAMKTYENLARVVDGCTYGTCISSHRKASSG
jgi:hypothetical protein